VQVQVLLSARGEVSDFFRKNFPEEGRFAGMKKSSRITVILITVILVLAAGFAFWYFMIRKEPDTSGEKTDSRTEITESDTEKTAGKKAEETEETKETAGETETAKAVTSAAQETTVQETEAPFVMPGNTSVNDANTPGNMFCYARLVSDGKKLYFRNPADQEKTYVMTIGQNDAAPFCDMYMKDIQCAGGWIYFCRTSPGDQGKTEDENIYRIKTDGTGLQKLTDISYGSGDAWLSFDTIADGYCYFSYQNGSEAHYRLARVKTDGSGFEDLFTVPTENCAGFMSVSFVNQKLYYQAKDGMNCLDIGTRENRLIVPGFSSGEFMFYDNVIYYTTSGSGQPASLCSVNPDGSGQRTVYQPSANESWMKLIRMNIYHGKLYFIGTVDDSATTAMGYVYTCNTDGSGLKLLLDHATWFNIWNDTMYYRFIDANDAASNLVEPFYSVDMKELMHADNMAKVSKTIVFQPKKQ
jgi:hypothetical protein